MPYVLRDGARLEGVKKEPTVIGFGLVRTPDGLYGLVGYSPLATNGNCGHVKTFRICPNDHSQVGLDGVSHAGKTAFQKVLFSCNKPSCPICFERWANREAGRAEFRFFEASKLYGKPEHCMASVPLKDYGKSPQWMHDMAVKMFIARGGIGGSLVFHPFRWDDVKLWFYAPHYHSVLFLKDGYRCRGCKKLCHGGCKGFEVTTRRLYENDGWIVKVLDPLHERVSVFKTIAYELKHAGVCVGVKHARVLTWWGVMSYRKLKLSDEARKKWMDEHKAKCPLCGSDFVDAEYCGLRDISSFEDSGLADVLENGFSAWRITEGER